jgi:hypothetical protein
VFEAYEPLGPADAQHEAVARDAGYLDLRTQRARRVFNVTMALLLAVSVALIVF